MKSAALDALQGERWVLGERVFRFEEEFARYCGVRFGVSAASGTFALQLSLLALGIKQGVQVVRGFLSSRFRPVAPLERLGLSGYA